MSVEVVLRRLARALDSYPRLKGAARRLYWTGRLIMLARRVSDSNHGAASILPSLDINSREFLAETIARFRARSLIGLESSEMQQREYSHAFQDAMLILSSEAFGDLPLELQVETIAVIRAMVMSVILRESVAIADAIARHYPRMLQHSEMTEPLACLVYDCLYALYFAGARNVSEMRAFDSECVAPFEAWLKARLPSAPRPPLPKNPRHICYFLHTGHFQKGNAVSPIIASLARAHAARPDRRIFLYAVQYVFDDLARAFEGSGVVVRTFPQDTGYNRIEEIATQMRRDRIDVAVSDLNAAVGAALFMRRVAPLQMWTVMGYPYWSLRELDWTLLIGMDHQQGFGIRRDRFSYLRVRQEAATLEQDCDPRALEQARASLPQGAFVFAVFSRLIKISGQLLDAAARLLEAETRAHLLIAGTGDPRLIFDFLERPELRGRVTFLHRNVDLNVYGRVVEAMLDTFPFHGGNSFREVVVHGKPVLAVLTPDWERLLRDERDPALLARDLDEFVAIALRLVRDPAFYAERSAEAIRLTQRIVDTTVMVDDVEEGIARAAAQRRVPMLSES